MTVNDIFTRALALMNETNQTPYTPFVIPVTNQLLSELFDVNNSILESRSLTPLTSPQTVVNVSDVLTYDTQLLSDTLPYGLAMWLVLDDDKQKYNLFSSMYENAKKKFTKCTYVDIVDAYEVE